MIVFCACSHRDYLDDGRRSAIRQLLKDSEQAWMEVDDLCAVLAEDTAPPAFLEGATIVACHARAVKWLFHRAGRERAPDLRVINARCASLDEIRDGIALSPPDHAPQHEPPLAKSGAANWYPVIDYARCKGCGQCVEFCLFGVYEKDATGMSLVTHPSGCKDNCPACARLCPEAAIIFPKHDEAPINGADVEDESAQQARIQLDTEALLGDDIYATLAARRTKRRLLTDEARQKALRERDTYRAQGDGGANARDENENG